MSTTGLPELRASLDDAASQLADLTAPGQAAGAALLGQAEEAAPRRTGELASSFGITVDQVTATVTNTAGHALPVQLGTRFMDAQPFMPADPAAIVGPIYAEYLDQVLSSIHGK